MAIDLSQFHATFLEESLEGLSAMESDLLAMKDGRSDADVVNGIFRVAHSIKGGAGTFGFRAIAEFAHVAETLLDELRSGRRQPSEELVGLLLESVDVLRFLLGRPAGVEEPEDQAVADLKVRLTAALNGSKGLSSSPATPAGSGPAGRGWRITFRPHPGLLRSGNEPYRLFRALGGLGPARVTCDTAELPSLEALDPEECHLAWTLELEAAVAEASVREVFDWVDGDCDLSLAPLAPPAGDPPRQEGARARAPSAESTSIRVGTDKLDGLVNLVGELVITQSMLSELGRAFDPSRLARLLAGLSQLERNTRELQDSIMGIRMIPISSTFNRFPRMVHDISGQLGKRVELRIAGEQTELDKTVIEKIGDPLVHLVRNALDHGLERPEVRRAAGKPEVGILRLEAFHRGGSIVIEVADDGAGLIRERLRAKAVERGLVEANAQLEDGAVLDLIFHPGFSTAAAVSDLSGRGVGTDVVRRNIKALGGSVEVRSTEGAGTTFTIKLPLTLAILDGQLARIGDQTFVFPLVSIVESIKLDPALLSRIAGCQEVYRLRAEYLPVLRAQRFLGIPVGEPTGPGLLVVVETEGRRAAVLVDDLLGQQQVVIKSLETNFRAVPGVSGATILGDGTAALILDVPGLIARSGPEEVRLPRATTPAAIPVAV
jgi:two-component system chemotaxis sensor kinase CheA